MGETGKANIDQALVHAQKLFALCEAIGSDIVCLTVLNPDASKFEHAFLMDGALSVTRAATPTGAQTFCQQVIDSAEPLIVPDMSKRPKEKCCPMMVAEGYAAYAGAPIFRGQKCIGAAEAISNVARIWNKDDILLLTGMANLVSGEIAQAEKLVELRSKQ